MSSDIFFGSRAVTKRSDLTIVSTPLPVYVPPVQRRRERIARIREMEAAQGLPLTPWPPGLEPDDEVDDLFDRLRAELAQ